MIEKKESPARERILKTATELFYQYGYHQTGTNEIIKKANVSKATFYSHFPTKDHLNLAYISNLNIKEIGDLKAAIHEKKTPRTRFMALIECIEPWIIQNGLKGCGFLRMVPEISNHADPVRKESKLHYETLKAIIKEISSDLIQSDGKKYSHLDVETLTNDYLTILTGAIALVMIHQELWPVRHARRQVVALIK